MPDNGDAMVLWRAFRAAHREIWEAIESSLDLPKNPRDKQLQTKLARARESLNSACRDAATLGWIPEEVRDFSKLQLLTCQPPYWRLVGACQQLDPYQAAFYDQEIGRGYRGQFEGKIAFVELPPNAVVLAHLLDIPIFRPRDPQYLLEEGPSEICGYLSELTERLLPFIREIVTRQPASGGLPMPEQVFEDRIARAGLQHPRFRLVASWPLTIPLEKPVGAVVAVPEGHSECFRYIESLEGYPTFLVHHRQVTDLEDAKKHRWCLDTPLAHALDSNGHAPFIQNLLRALDPEHLECLERDGGLLAILGKKPQTCGDRRPSIPSMQSVDKDFLERVFSNIQVRAAALLLVCDDMTAALAQSSLRWPETVVAHLLLQHGKDSGWEMFQGVFGIDLADTLSLSIDEVQRKILARVTDGEALSAISKRLGQRTPYRLDDHIFGTVQEAEAELGPKVDLLQLTHAGSAAGEELYSRTGRAARGGENQFARSGSVVGRLGERYAQRWLKDGPGRMGLAVFDVSTRDQRAQAMFPESYQQRDPSISPGCDLLVFEQGNDELPTGYEVKARREDGPIVFEWTPREREACWWAGRKQNDPHWPLGGYRVILISNLLSGDAPQVTFLNRRECLKGTQSTKYMVRAKSI
jgi:hypothetical protein